MDTKTLRCGLLGRKLGHSYSPAIHRRLGVPGATMRAPGLHAWNMRFFAATKRSRRGMPRQQLFA